MATSHPFRFTIGPEKQEFWVHSAVISRLSPVLNVLINGTFKEGRNLHAELETVDPDTFSSFLRYAYAGDNAVGIRGGGGEQGYTPDLFVSDARLYVFADYYGIERLAKISLWNLERSLATFDLVDDNTVNDAVKLLIYCFEDDRPEQLRKRMAQYASRKAKQLMKNPAFCELLGGNNGLSVAMIRRMVGLE